MKKIFRTLKREEKAEAKALWGYAFGTEEPYYLGFFENFFIPENALGLFLDETLATVGFLIPQKVRVRKEILRSAFLVGITTRAELRGKGLFKDWMLGTIAHLTDAGYDLSMLVPFETAFYKPFGFETCYALADWDVPLSSLPKASDGKGEKVSDLSEISDIYEKFAEKYHGSVVREELDWAHVKLEMTSEGAHAVRLSDNGGYAIYCIKDNTLKVLEWVYLSEASKRQLLSFLRSHMGQAERVTFSTPADDTLIFTINDKISPKRMNLTKLRPYQSVRVLDPDGLLKKLGVKADLSRYSIGEISQIIMGVYDGLAEESLRSIFDRKVNFMRENFM